MNKNPDPPPLMPGMMSLLALPSAWIAASAAWPRLKEKKLQKAVRAEAENRAHDMLAGVARYLETPYERSVSEPPTIWSKGSARLLDYKSNSSPLQEEGEIVLFIPSLINRYYILDLEKNRSFLRYLARQGLHPFVLDWGAPGKAEASYGLEDYLARILLPAIEFLHQSTGRKITLAGYCMGGVLALMAAGRTKKHIMALALLATPWDFHCKSFSPFVLDEEWRPFIASLISRQRFLPAAAVQSLFYLTDPWVFEHKFRRFFAMDQKSRSARDFVALEHWVNDGVAMTSAVARDCLIGWAQENALMNGVLVDPGKIKIPTFIAIPKNDHVVPHDCAMPLAQRMKHATILHPSAGHVGMIVGKNAKRELWEPFAGWVRATGLSKHRLRDL